MVVPELESALGRSTAPVPEPGAGETIRVPLTGTRLIAPLGGAILGPFAFVALSLVPPLGDGPSATRSASGPPLMLLAMILGALLGFGVVWERTRGRAIAFDARGVWIEGPGGSFEPLAWDGMRRRGGRMPRLVAEDGRILPLSRERLAPGPDASYLMAWINRLPEIPAPPRVPRAVFPALTVLGIVLLAIAIALYPSPTIETEGPYWNPPRVEGLAAMLAGFPLIVGGGLASLVRYADSGEWSKVGRDAPKPGDELAAWIRTHRFRPPAIPLHEGVTYGYREPEFWRTGVTSKRGARILALGIALLVFGLSIAGAFPSRDGRRGFDGTLVGLGTLNLVVMGGLALFMPRANRGGWTIRVVGDRALISDDRHPETAMPWPPVRTRAASGTYDWTDELRDGRRRVRFDRRLLVPVEG